MGDPSIYVLIFMVNKELAWPIAWEEKPEVREMPWNCGRQMQVVTLPSKPQPHGITQINGDGLN